MTSRNTINLFLFLFVSILIVILFLDTNNSTQSTFNLSSLKETEINTIEITRLTSNPLKFKKNIIKDNTQWYMVSPYKVRANTFYIESLLRIIQAKSASQFIISESDKTKFKLNPPQATLKLNTQVFLFGTNEQLNLNRYILSNEKLYLIPDRFFYLLNSSTTGFIDHALIGKNEKIVGLKLVDYDIQFIDNKWQIKPASKYTSTDDINQLISEWNNSQAIEISKLTNVNNSDSKFSVKLKLKNKKQDIVFGIVIKDDSYFFIRQDLKLQFKLNQDMAYRLLKLPKQEERN